MGMLGAWHRLTSVNTAGLRIITPTEMNGAAHTSQSYWFRLNSSLLGVLILLRISHGHEWATPHHPELPVQKEDVQNPFPIHLALI